MIIENEYTVKLSEIGKDNKATNKAILSYLEDIGGIHSNKAGYGVYEIPQTHLSWVLLGWKLQVLRRPNYAEKIKYPIYSVNHNIQYSSHVKLITTPIIMNAIPNLLNFSSPISFFILSNIGVIRYNPIIIYKYHK